jgi:hypothetical protein
VLGAWSGEVTQTGPSGKRVRISQFVNIERKGGTLKGTSNGDAHGSPIHCSGQLTHRATRRDVQVFDYVEEQDPDNCLARTTVTLRPTGRDLHYEEVYGTNSGRGTIEGTLTRSGCGPSYAAAC